MARTTIEFSTLRERNNRDLERIHDAGDPLGEVTDRQKQRIQRLLGKRAEIEDLASTQNQREAYGIEAWHRDFVRLRDLHTAPGTHHEGEALRNIVWKAVPNSRFKRFQQLFSHPHQWIVPPFDIDTNGTVTFRDAPDFDGISLKGCLVSPDLIPDELADTIALTTFGPEDERRPERRLRKKHGDVQRLKKLWESTVSLQDHHHRVLEIAKPTPEIDQVYGDVPGPDPEALGSVLYVREQEQERGAQRKLTVQHFDSAYGAYRKTLHEEQVHETEITALASMNVQVQTLIQRFDTEWRDPEAREQLIGECSSTLSECVRSLELCTNTYKVEARDLLAKAHTLRDSLGRQNVSATMARMVGVINRFSERYHEMFPKGGYNQQDRMALQRSIKEQEAVLWNFRKSVVEGAPVLSQENIALFNGHPMSDNLIAANVSGLLKRMNVHPRPLARVTVQPLGFYSRELQESYRDLEAALMTRDQTMAKQTVLRMHLLGKFQAVRSWFEKLKADMVDADHLSLGRIRAFVSALEELFSTFQIYPGEVIEDFRRPFEEMQAGLRGLQALLSEYEGKDIDVSAHTMLLKRVKEYITEINVEEEAAKLQ